MLTESSDRVLEFVRPRQVGSLIVRMTHKCLPPVSIFSERLHIGIFFSGTDIAQFDLSQGWRGGRNHKFGCDFRHKKSGEIISCELYHATMQFKCSSISRQQQTLQNLSNTTE